MSMRRTPRSGFTLVELLVATGVFMIGFSAAFGLFLAAIRYRTMADDTIRLSLAASSLVEELAIGNGQTATGLPLRPSQYLGAGNLPPNSNLIDPKQFYAYSGVPGTWYTVESCTDVLGGDNHESATLHLNLLVLVFTQADQPLTLEDVNRRVRILTPSAGFRGTLDDTGINSEVKQVRDGLVQRGLAMRISAVVLRRPSWM
jgi:Tfp pilus assembly protein PilV